MPEEFEFLQHGEVTPRLSVPLIRQPFRILSPPTLPCRRSPPLPPCPKLLNEEEAGEASPCGSYLLHDQ